MTRVYKLIPAEEIKKGDLYSLGTVGDFKVKSVRKTQWFTVVLTFASLLAEPVELNVGSPQRVAVR